MKLTIDVLIKRHNISNIIYIANFKYIYVCKSLYTCAY